MKKGQVTLSRGDLKRIIAMLEILTDRCAAAQGCNHSSSFCE